MSIERPANERLALYERFKLSLEQGSAEADAFFDADDLVIIIDQAVDLEDEYVEIEAIMRGYRYFPDNEELMARRAFLYYDLNLDRGVDNVSRQLRPDAPLTRILEIRRLSSIPGPEEVDPMLDAIVAIPEKFDDETIIQLVDCAGACNRVDWLIANEPKLRTKTDYLPTLLYELFIVADMNNRHEWALKLLEELTEIEPFNIDFWNALAQVQATDYPDEARSADLESALTSVDFALAIDSENEQSITLKASILFRLDRAAEAAELMAPMADAIPSAIAADVYVRALYTAGQATRAVELLQRYCRQFPESHDLMNMLLVVSETDVSDIIRLHYDACESQPELPDNWIDWAAEFYARHEFIQCVILIDILLENATEKGLTNGQYIRAIRLLVSALYYGGDYDRCIKILTDVVSSPHDFIPEEVIIGGLMAQVQKHDKAATKELLQKVIKCFPLPMFGDWTLSVSLRSLGMVEFLNRLNQAVELPGQINPDDFNFFTFPQSKPPF